MALISAVEEPITDFSISRYSRVPKGVSLFPILNSLGRFLSERSSFSMRLGLCCAYLEFISINIIYI